MTHKRFVVLLMSVMVLIAILSPAGLAQATTYFYNQTYLGGGSCSTSGFSLPTSGSWSLPPGGGIHRLDNGISTASNFVSGSNSATGIDHPNLPVPSSEPYTYTIDYLLATSTAGSSVIYHTILTINCGSGDAFSVTIQNGVGTSASLTTATHCTVGSDGRVNGLCGDRIAVYCNASANPPNIDIWVIDNDGKGSDLITIKLSDLTAVSMGAYLKNLGVQGTVFAGLDKQGNGYVALQGGPYKATAKGDWAKLFTCADQH